MDSLVVFQDQARNDMPSDLLRLEDYEVPNLPSDFFDSCDNELDFSSEFTPLNSEIDTLDGADDLALVQEPAVMNDSSDSTSTRGVTSSTDKSLSPPHMQQFTDELQLQNVGAGDTLTSDALIEHDLTPIKAEDINPLSDERRIDNAISSLTGDCFPELAQQATWDRVQVMPQNWQDIANAQIEAATSGLRNPVTALAQRSASRAPLPPTGGAISKGHGRAVRGKRGKAGGSASARAKSASGNKRGAQKSPQTSKKAKNAKFMMANLSEEEQKRIRRVKNRASVEKCRNKQRMRLEALQKEKESLTNENSLLRSATDRVRQSMNSVLSQVAALSGVNCRIQLT